jgi:2-hydroxy-3-oxopropionate reductase
MFERFIKVPLENDDSAAKFAISNATKDLRYYTNMAESLPMTAFMAEVTHQTFVMALNRGYRDKFIPRLVDLICEINNVKLRKG